MAETKAKKKAKKKPKGIFLVRGSDSYYGDGDIHVVRGKPVVTLEEVTVDQVVTASGKKISGNVRVKGTAKIASVNTRNSLYSFCESGLKKLGITLGVGDYAEITVGEVVRAQSVEASTASLTITSEDTDTY